MRRKQRTWAVGATIIAGMVAVVAAACAPPTSSGADLSGELPTEIPEGTSIVVADQQNQLQTLLSASGLGDALPYRVDFANFTGGPEVLEAFRAGTADVAPVGDTPPIFAQLTDQKVPIILGLENKKQNIVLATSPQSGITTPQDLRGKKIAYAEGTAQQVVVLRALANAGLTPDDVSLVPIKLAEFSEALGSNEVDAAPLNEPRLTRYLRDYGADGGSSLSPDSTGQISEGLSFLYARAEALADPAKSAALRDFVGVVIRAKQWTNEHPQDWIDAYYVKNQQVSADDGQRILDSIGRAAVPPLDDALIARQQGTIDVLDAAGALPKKVRADDGVDKRFAPVIEEAARASGIPRESGGLQ